MRALTWCGVVALALTPACEHRDRPVAQDAPSHEAPLDRADGGAPSAPAQPPPGRTENAASPRGKDGTSLQDASTDAPASPTDASASPTDAHEASDAIQVDAASLPSCLEDVKAAGAVIVRLSNRSTPPSPEGPPCALQRLMLEVPSLRIERELCRAMCGPYLLESHASEGGLALECDDDFHLLAGSIRVEHGVIVVDLHPKALPGGFDAPQKPAPPPPPQAIPLPCGARVSFVAGGRKASGPSEPKSGR